jgi:hypothetical protein
MRMYSIAFIMLALSASGCAPGPEIDGSQFLCQRGLTRPFSVKTLIRVAREHGVSLKRNPSCGASWAEVDAAENQLVTDDLDEADKVDAREGGVICHVEDMPFDTPPFGVRRTKYETDHETYFDVANVSCAIYPTGQGQIARLEIALKALAKAPVERRSCPHAHPRPVTVARLIAAGRRHGLRLLPDARCIEPGVVAQASTIVPYDRHPTTEDQVWYDQGEVTCLVRKKSVPGAKRVTATPLSSGLRFDFLNVSCKIIPDPRKKTVQVGRLRATLEEFG